MDPVSLAVAAVAVVTPYLIASAEGAANDPTPDAGRSVWNWVKARLTSGADRAAVVEAEAAPAIAQNAQALQAALTTVLRKDSAAAVTLAKLLNDRVASP